MSEQPLPISLDIETSGGNPVEHGIWQIGAVDLNTMEEFLDESRIDDEEIVIEEALKVTGKTEKELRDKNKQSQKELLEKFFRWLEERRMKNLLCHLPEFDKGFLKYKAIKYFEKDPFWPDHHRAFDMHTIAQIKFLELNGKFLTKDDNNSDMGLKNILKLCGIEDTRRSVREGEISREGKPHNALEDAKLTAECFSRLIYGKNLFPEYAKFEIPMELRK
ncbi:3'-5' exonuclease [Candidatus Pacearchaeota archaeon]|nr:3'-5' exonuclease [Candidatus Pacearchaeota archaeon]